MNNGPAKIQIFTEEESKITHVYLDGNEIDGVTDLDLQMGTGQLPLLQLNILARDVDVMTQGEVQTDDMDKPISYLDLTARTYNSIRRGRVSNYVRDNNQTVRDVVVAYKSGRLKNYYGIGKKSYQEVKEKLKSLGLLIGGEENE